MPAIKNGIINTYEAAKYCQSINETSSSLIERKLSEFGPKKSKDGKFQIGYMLSFPLLSYVKMHNDGSYEIDKGIIRYRLKLLPDTKRQAVIYLFSNHFSVSEGAKTEELISKIDGKHMMQLSNGIVPVDNYFSSKTYPWAINASNSLSDKIRKDAINEVLSQVCALDIVDQQKIRAVTVPGEVHYTFPDFFNGMGYRGEMQLTDYSENSIKRFRNYLFDKYKNIKSLNDTLGSEYRSFYEINPPSKNINTVHLNNFFEHLDYASSGRLAIYGWAAGNGQGPAKVRIFIDGKDVGYAESGLSRMDVYQAIPTLGTSAVGYRYYLDFRKMSKGIHVVDVVHDDNGKLTLMKSIDVPVMDRQQTKPVRVGEGIKLLEEKSMKFWNDYPETLQPVYYNPLSEEFYNFRKKEVAREIQKYADIVSSSCIGRDRTFSHQIAPMFNADWNEEKIAVEDSLKKNNHYNIGLNACGSAFYGDYIFNWLKTSGIESYGIPEVHPMVENEEIIYDALEHHHNNGAIFISPYYLEMKPESFGVDKEHKKFSINENNTNYYSSSFYHALSRIMKE
ncbi:TPA: beta-galactosidase [Klebsiella pneumoniae]|nr:beta-galactosidase [Klebsiella pneumoniae]